MNALTDKEFLEFFESFNERTYEEIKKDKSIIHKCYDSITELSRSDSYPYDSLITKELANEPMMELRPPRITTRNPSTL